ncbi:site-specific integrase [Aquirufa aurantiipilula]|uniref:site-specific integrase n=1 Tax=Aquirufa aurantiipilula TaxID=2696561 RepID=UPI001CAA6856|nr:site-specific integrase [Aquirufa aurantiipilula]MBZ1327735.1 site-specific integrase [Aquirufa aurantiipilula]
MKLFNDLSLQFNLRKQQGAKTKFQKIYCRISYKGYRRNFSTGLWTTESSWCKVTEKVKSKEPLSLDLNEQLTLIKQKVINTYFDSKDKRKDLSLDIIQSEVFPSSKHIDLQMEIEPEITSPIEVNIISRRYLDDLKVKFDARIISIGTYKSYRSAIIRFLHYVKMYYGSKKTSLTSIDKLFFFKFESYLLIDCKFGNNYTHKVLSNTRKLFNFAYDLGLLETKFAFKFKVRYTNPHRAILNMEEVKTLINLQKLNSLQEEVRDCFLFQCFTGLAFAEIKGLKAHNIKTLDEEKWVVINRQKTGNESKLILLPIAETILNRYFDHPYCHKTNQLLPIRNNAKYNKTLKEIQAAAKLNTKLSSHIARHIFASTIALQFGLPMETLAKALGHTNLRTTMIYGKILDNKIKNDFDILKRNLKDLS